MSGVREVLDRMRAGNARYVAAGGQPRDHSVDREAVASRAAIATVLTCSDIKVVPEQVFGLEIGDLNVIQTAACVCINPESFGFEMPGIGEPPWLIVVLGHTPCGVIEYSLADHADPLNSVIDVILESRVRLVAAGTLATPTSVCEAHLARTTRELRMSLDPDLSRVEAAHVDESSGVVRFLDVDDVK